MNFCKTTGCTAAACALAATLGACGGGPATPGNPKETRMNRPASCLPTLLLCATVAVAGLGAAASVHATSPDWSRVDSAQLEALFWDCDVRAAQEALSAGDGALCASASDALKERLFDGDFEQLLAWWRAQKAAEYARRGADVPLPAADEAQDDDLALQAP